MPNIEQDFDRRAFRTALGAFATGVTIVTASDSSGHKFGLTANSFNSVSLDPPMVLWSLAKSSSLLAGFMDATHFGVHILANDQEALSARFAGRAADRFAELAVERGHGGIPLLDGASARFQCRTAFRYEGGDHIIFVGDVLAFEQFDRRPLVYHGGRYGKLMPPADPTPSQPAEIPQGGFGTDLLSWLLTRAHFQLVARLRPEIARHTMSDEAFLILSTLATAGKQRRSTVQDMLRFMGFTGMPACVGELADSSMLVASPEGGADPELEITPTGRCVMVELMATARAIEAEAEFNLDQEERALLHALLRKVIRNTDPQSPALWRVL